MNGREERLSLALFSPHFIGVFFSPRWNLQLEVSFPIAHRSPSISQEQPSMVRGGKQIWFLPNWKFKVIGDVDNSFRWYTLFLIENASCQRFLSLQLLPWHLPQIQLGPLEKRAPGNPWGVRGREGWGHFALSVVGSGLTSSMAVWDSGLTALRDLPGLGMGLTGVRVLESSNQPPLTWPVPSHLTLRIRAGSWGVLSVWSSWNFWQRSPERSCS